MVDTVIREATGRLAGNSPVKVTAERETSTLPAGSLRAPWSTVQMTVLSQCLNSPHYHLLLIQSSREL